MEWKKIALLITILLCTSCAHYRDDWSVKIGDYEYKHDPVDKTDIVIAIASTVATAADCYTTYEYDWDRYYNPLMRERDDVIPVTIGLHAAVLTVAYFLPQKLRRAALSFNGGCRLLFTAINIRRKP